MARVLSAAAHEPSVLRWLHALDPDRNLSGELLRSSVRYSTALDATEQVMDGMPRETASLFMPMYRRSSFVLGQLYGPMSPNTLALALLSAPAPPPTPRSRRFVVDLAAQNPVEFVEYEWLSDGKLCISLHEIAATGVYSGQTLVFKGARSAISPVPSTLAMTLNYHEAPLPDRASPAVPPGWRAQPVSWETWTAVFARLRTGSTSMTTKVSIPTGPAPDAPSYETEFRTLLREECAVGEAGLQSTGANKLVRMFLQAQGMFITHPAQDEAVIRPSEARAFADAVSGLYDEDNDPQPQYAPQGSLAGSGFTQHPANLAGDPDPAPDDPMMGNHSSAVDGVREAARRRDEQYLLNPPPPMPEFVAHPSSWPEAVPSSASVSPIGTDSSGESGPDTSKTGTSGAAAAAAAAGRAAAAGAGPARAATAEAGGLNKPRKAAAAPKEHVCQCGMRFLHRGHFNAHRRAVHEKVRPHVCSYRNCESAFAKRSDLLRHQLSQHSEDVRFACSQCSVSFPDKAQLALHFSSLHDQDRPFKCVYCPRSYSTRSGLRKHNINKHADQIAAAAAARSAAGASSSVGAGSSARAGSSSAGAGASSAGSVPSTNIDPSTRQP